MPALICGAFSYDTVMVFNDKFKHHLNASPVDGEHEDELDLYFMVPDLRRQFGGGAGNISYNLKMLGEEPLPMATVGKDFDPYAEWLGANRIRQDYVTRTEHSITAQTIVTIDMGDNHITAFHPGAMALSQLNQVWQAKAEISLGTICSDERDAMLQHALEFVELGVPFVFDPGYALYQFDADELMKFIEQANWVLVNKREWQYLAKHTGLTPQQAGQRLQGLIITQGAKGALIYAQGTCYQIPSAQAKAVNDPSGCGDAFCAGLLYGLLKDIDWETTGRIAALIGAIKVEHHGTQNHKFTLELFKMRFKKNFGYALLL